MTVIPQYRRGHYAARACGIVTLNGYAAFFFETFGTKKKANKKEMPIRISLLRERFRGCAPLKTCTAC